jgi:hypothetical protein
MPKTTKFSHYEMVNNAEIWNCEGQDEVLAGERVAEHLKAGKTVNFSIRRFSRHDTFCLYSADATAAQIKAQADRMIERGR